MIIGEHYSFDRNQNIIGRGGFGTVYKGLDRRHQNVVAVKEVFKSKLDTKLIERELEIIQLLSSINHSNIVVHYHVESNDNCIFFVMEFCNYEDLESYYDMKTPLEESEMLLMIKQLASGLEVLYLKNIIHRDLKPMNILLHNSKNLQQPTMETLTLKISGFSVSTFISASTQATSIVGTPSYMAPEVYTEEAYGHKADVWSAGLIIYKGLYKKLPQFLENQHFSNYIRFWQSLKEINAEPTIEYRQSLNAKLDYLLRYSLKRNIVDRITMEDFLNIILRKQNIFTLESALLELPLINKLNFPECTTPFIFENTDFCAQERIYINNRSVIEKCHFKPLSKFVARKSVRIPLHLIEEAHIDKISDELKNYVNFQHSPFLVDFYGICIYKEYIIYCMEIMDISLKDLYYRSHLKYKEFPLDLIGCVCVAYLNALDWLKNRQILKRNIGSKNILFNDGKIKISLGGSSHITESSLTTTYVGTMVYWPPERFQLTGGVGNNITISSNIWSLGVVVCEALLGRNPLSAEGSGFQIMPQSINLMYITSLAILKATIMMLEELFHLTSNKRIRQFVEQCLKPVNERPTLENLMETSLYKYYTNISTPNFILSKLVEMKVFEELNQLREEDNTNVNEQILKFLPKIQQTIVGNLIFPGDIKLYAFDLDTLQEKATLDRNKHIVKTYWHSEAKKEFVIKFLQMPQSRFQGKNLKEQEWQKLAQELSVHRSLRMLPNVVCFYGFTLYDSQLLIAMELMDINLNTFYLEIHDSYKFFDENLLACIAIAVINALTYCSEHNIIHRDIKPTNILLNKHGEIKLCDFGESRILQENSLATTGSGTLYYWSPERFQVSEYDIRSDIWSFGITLVEVVKGRIPYEDAKGNVPTDFVTLQSCIRNTKTTDIINTCFGDKYTVLSKNFILKCLENIDSRFKKYEELKQTEYYDHYSKNFTDNKCQLVIKAFEDLETKQMENKQKNMEN